MGVPVDVIVFGVAGADAVNSLNQGFDPVGYAGSTISVAANAAQLGVSAGVQFGVATPSIATITSITQASQGASALGAGLTAVQVKIDLDAGRDIKIGDVISIGTAIPVGIAVAVGVISTTSILVPVAVVAGLAAAALNIGGFTLSDIFRKMQEITLGRALTDQEKIAADRFATANASVFDANQIDYDIMGNVNSNFTSAQNYVIPRRDPLVLDLDGDGLELVAANGTVLFDHNADGIKTGTGWVSPDDGLLVRDLNGNGTIDSGRELFGIDTVKANNTLAANGFDALRELDSNADGFITHLDAAYAELKVWRDANQDGISQAAELQSLSALGISSIGVNGTATGPQAGQVIAGNRVDLSTMFTQNGVVRTVGAIDFQVNNFYSQFAAQVVDQAGNPVAITAQALALPQMNGSGMVRNMQAAANYG